MDLVNLTCMGCSHGGLSRPDSRMIEVGATVSNFQKRARRASMQRLLIRSAPIVALISATAGEGQKEIPSMEVDQGFQR